MSEESTDKDLDKKSSDDPKAKMLEALAKKQKGLTPANHQVLLVVLRLVLAKQEEQLQRCIEEKLDLLNLKVIF